MFRVGICRVLNLLAFLPPLFFVPSFVHLLVWCIENVVVHTYFAGIRKKFTVNTAAGAGSLKE